MKRILVLLLALLFACNHYPAPAQPTGTPDKPFTPEVVEPAIYKLVASTGPFSGWTGTGWKYDDKHMLTAGHVCDTEGRDGVLEIKAVGRWNLEYPAKVIKFSGEPDICLLSVEVPGPSLRTFKQVPNYGAEVWYSGAPHGVFGDGTVPFAKGFYIGGYRMMIAGYPGASGSPVYTREGVVGILVRGWRGTHMMEFETTSEILQFLKE